MRKSLSLHPLTFDEALAGLLKIKPAARGKKGRQKPKVARRKTKKKIPKGR